MPDFPASSLPTRLESCGRGPSRVAGRTRTCVCIWAVCAAALSLVAAGAGAPSLRDVLTQEEFKRAGLEKLSAEELEFLSRRLLDTTTSGAPAVPATSGPAVGAEPPRAETTAAPVAQSPLMGDAAFGQEGKLREQIEKQHGIPDVLTSRISGPFSGWTGRTVFRLENGQVWQQIDDDRFAIKIDNPVVKIERTRFGSYLLSLEGYGSRTKVRRVR